MVRSACAEIRGPDAGGGIWIMDVHMLWHFMDYAVLKSCLYGLGEAFGMESWAFGLRAVYHENGLDGLWRCGMRSLAAYGVEELSIRMYLKSNKPHLTT